MLRLYLQAPFAACRPFAAGWYRPTAGFLTPSAAYGLLLNVAAIESRVREEDPAHAGRVATTLTRNDLPRCRIALGLAPGTEPPRVQSVFQQLHNYPVGRDTGLPWEMAKGSKNNITPVRRELLVGLRAVIAVDDGGNADLEERVRSGLSGSLNDSRYGLPFLGDNSFLIDRLEVLSRTEPVRWYERVADPGDGPRVHATRLTWWIDRADMSRTRSDLYAPSEVPLDEPPDAAWTKVGAADADKG